MSCRTRPAGKAVIAWVRSTRRIADPDAVRVVHEAHRDAKHALASTATEVADREDTVQFLHLLLGRAKAHDGIPEPVRLGIRGNIETAIALIDQGQRRALPTRAWLAAWQRLAELPDERGRLPADPAAAGRLERKGAAMGYSGPVRPDAPSLQQSALQRLAAGAAEAARQRQEAREGLEKCVDARDALRDASGGQQRQGKLEQEYWALLREHVPQARPDTSGWTRRDAELMRAAAARLDSGEPLVGIRELQGQSSKPVLWAAAIAGCAAASLDPRIASAGDLARAIADGVLRTGRPVPDGRAGPAAW